jgi:hypothetical protein
MFDILAKDENEFRFDPKTTSDCDIKFETKYLADSSRELEKSMLQVSENSPETEYRPDSQNWVDPECISDELWTVEIVNDIEAECELDPESPTERVSSREIE